MAKAKQSPPREFRSLDAYTHHYFPKQVPVAEGTRDIRAAAQILAAGTVQSVRKQLAKT